VRPGVFLRDYQVADLAFYFGNKKCLNLLQRSTGKTPSVCVMGYAPITGKVLRHAKTISSRFAEFMAILQYCQVPQYLSSNMKLCSEISHRRLHHRASKPDSQTRLGRPSWSRPTQGAKTWKSPSLLTRYRGK
jgi:hypothetical protein